MWATNGASSLCGERTVEGARAANLLVGGAGRACNRLRRTVCVAPRARQRVVCCPSTGTSIALAWRHPHGWRTCLISSSVCADRRRNPRACVCTDICLVGAELKGVGAVHGASMRCGGRSCGARRRRRLAAGASAPMRAVAGVPCEAHSPARRPHCDSLVAPVCTRRRLYGAAFAANTWPAAAHTTDGAVSDATAVRAVGHGHPPHCGWCARPTHMV